MSIPIYFAVSPEELAQKLPQYCHSALLGFFIDPERPVLWGPISLPKSIHMMVLEDRFLLQYDPSRTFARQIVQYACKNKLSIFLDFLRTDQPSFDCFAEMISDAGAEYGIEVWVPERLGKSLHAAGVVVQSPAKAQNYSLQLVSFCNRFPNRCILELQPVNDIEILHAPHTASASFNAADFYSSELCCRYKITWNLDVVNLHLFDTNETLQQKCILAEQAGCKAVIGLYQEYRAMLPG